MDYQLRPRKSEDDKFVIKLFCEHKVKELNAEQWPEVMRLQFCNIQYLAFNRSIIQKFYNLEDNIITTEAKPIGRIILAKTKSQINIIYLSLLSEFQNKRVGKKVINTLINEAKLNQKNILLQVSKENPAFHLYKKLGFKVRSDDSVKYQMVYSPSTES